MKAKHLGFKRVSRRAFFDAIGNLNVHPRIVGDHYPFVHEWRLQSGPSPYAIAGISRDLAYVLLATFQPVESPLSCSLRHLPSVRQRAQRNLPHRRRPRPLGAPPQGPAEGGAQATGRLGRMAPTQTSPALSISTTRTIKMHLIECTFRPQRDLPGGNYEDVLIPPELEGFLPVRWQCQVAALPEKLSLLTDELRHLPGAPAWVQQYPGPFEIDYEVIARIENQRYYAITGRIVGDDEDAAWATRSACSRERALELFRSYVATENQKADDPIEDPQILITNIFVSGQPINLVFTHV